MTKGIKSKTVKIPLYHGRLVIMATNDLTLVDKKYGLPPSKGFDAMVFNNDTENGFSVYCVAFDTDYITFHNVAHEAFHVVTNIFKDRGMYIDLSNDEPAAYLLGWVVKEIHKFIKVKA